MDTLFLTKSLAFFIYPLSIAIFVACIALALTFTRWSVVGQVLLGISLGGLWMASTPVFANWLNSGLESQFEPIAVEALPEKDAIIVLGGGTVSQPLPPRVAADLGGAVDRIIHAMRIYRAGKSQIIVVSAGNLPWCCAKESEAQLIADLLAELGVPRSAIVLETEARTTRENAANTAVLFEKRQWENALLVTSGAHMPRALAVFQKAGLDVTPAATDVHAVTAQSASLRSLLPTVGALAATTSAIKELIGLRIYRYLGWA